MSTAATEDRASLHRELWDMANNLRSQMTANQFQNYILGLIFYRYLSDKVEARTERLLEFDEISFEEAWENEQYKNALIDTLTKEIGYVIQPKHLFSNMIKEINKGESGTFDTEMLQEAINYLMESTIGEESQGDFENLFEDMDLTSSTLGSNVATRSDVLAKVILNVNEIPNTGNGSNIDVLGDTYEYLISRFAANAGQKAGEFYTPRPVSQLLARIVTHGKENIRAAYDPTCGSGSLLLHLGDYADVRSYYGQELTSSTYNLARMNMMLHDINFRQFEIVNGDTLIDPAHLDMRFDAIVANPPYSQRWDSADRHSDDERFNEYGRLVPKGRADFAFVQHMIYQLSDEGTLAVVLPHGVLFRGAAEEAVRKYLIEEKNYLDAVIGLPANIFFGTSIPTTVLVFKKNREEDADVVFIDASEEFERQGNKNTLNQAQVDKIFDTYINREPVDKYAFVATREDIEKNDYNLNIPRYVDTFEEEEPVDIPAVKARLTELDEEIAEIDKELEQYFKELGV